METTYIYNSGISVSYGYWICPECGSEFAGGGSAIHKRGCSKKGYEGLMYQYSHAERNRWNEEVLSKGFLANLPLSPNGLAKHFLVEAIAKRAITPDQVRTITTEYVTSLDVSLLPAIMERLEELLDSVA